MENPAAEEGDFKSYINENSLQIIDKAYVEPALLDAKPGHSFQFLRKGYFTLDPVHSSENNMVFNRTATLKDTWAKSGK